MINEKQDLDFTLLNVGYAEHNADWNFKNVESPFARIHLVTEGSASIVRGNEEVVLNPGYLYMTPAYTPHSYVCDGKFSVFYIHLYENPELPASIFDTWIFPLQIKSDPILFELVQRLYRINPGRELSYFDPRSYDNRSELIRNIAKQVNTPLAIEAETKGITRLILARFLAEATAKRPHVDKRLAVVLNYIHKNLHEPISIDLLASLSYLTKDHLIRIFKSHLGSTPGKYINRKKIEKAQLMIIIGSPSIQQLAFSLGFENVSYFNRLFKKLTGETPSSYKKRIVRLR